MLAYPSKSVDVKTSDVTRSRRNVVVSSKNDAGTAGKLRTTLVGVAEATIGLEATNSPGSLKLPLPLRSSHAYKVTSGLPKGLDTGTVNDGVCPTEKVGVPLIPSSSSGDLPELSSPSAFADGMPDDSKSTRAPIVIFWSVRICVGPAISVISAGFGGMLSVL